MREQLEGTVVGPAAMLHCTIIAIFREPQVSRKPGFIEELALFKQVLTPVFQALIEPMVRNEFTDSSI
jgi:hypothetical protein